MLFLSLPLSTIILYGLFAFSSYLISYPPFKSMFIENYGKLPIND